MYLKPTNKVNMKTNRFKLDFLPSPAARPPCSGAFPDFRGGWRSSWTRFCGEKFSRAGLCRVCDSGSDPGPRRVASRLRLLAKIFPINCPERWDEKVCKRATHYYLCVHRSARKHSQSLATTRKKLFDSWNRAINGNTCRNMHWRQLSFLLVNF